MPGFALPNFQPSSAFTAGLPTSVTLTPTSMQTSVTDPITSHVYTFSEAREVGQYWNGQWFVVGGTGNAVEITSITPVSTSTSTAAYTQPDLIDDEATVGAQTRWMHGAMVNPGQGRVAPTAANFGWDNYRGVTGSSSSVYEHTLNVDPGKTGANLSVTEGSVVKAESFTTEGGHTSSSVDKTRILHFSCLTVVPEVPAANSFRPPIRGTDKRSYNTTDQVSYSGRQFVSGQRPFTTTEIDTSEARIAALQQTWYIHQEPSRRWNPGARGNAVDVYGDDWYHQFSRFFAADLGDYTLSEREDITLATIQVGIDIYGNFVDGDIIYPSQAHHAGRKGIVFAAGLLLNDSNILAQCDADTYPDNFGVDDGITGYVTSAMVDKQPQFYKSAWPYKWETEHVGIPEWSNAFWGSREAEVETLEQVIDPDIGRRSYQVLSVDNGMMYQALWGMTRDPSANYYKDAYFDFMDRYLAIRIGDQVDGVWDASSDDTGTNGHFTGNWWSINPNATTVGYFKAIRDAITSRSNYITQLPPEPLPKPQVSHTGTNAYLDVDFNTNDFRMPQNKDVAITGYDLRWTAYAGGADTAASEDVDEYVGNFDWQVIEDVTIPYQLTGVPRGLKVKVQIRMKNANGNGPWLDDRKRENYNGTQTFSVLAGDLRYSTNFDVPDITQFDQIPINFKTPSATPETAVTTGAVASGNEGIWSTNPAITATDYQWQVSDDGSTGWSDISGATSIDFTTTSSEEDKFIRLGVRKTNSEGTSAYSYGSAGLPVIAPAATALSAANHGTSAYDPGAGALGGKRLLILYTTRHSGAITVGGTIGAYSFGASEAIYTDNPSGGGERQIAYIVDVTGGETATTITFTHSDADNTTAAYELSAAMTLHDSTKAVSALTNEVDTADNGAVFWMGRSAGSVAFSSSSTLVAHPDNTLVGDSTDDAWDFAHDLGTGAGTASVTHTWGASSNSRVTLISLEPSA